MYWLRSKMALLLIALSLLTLACRFSFELPWNVGPSDVAISPEDVSVAATRAAVAAATAASLANQAGQIAATAVLEGDNIVSTAVAGEGFPGIGSAGVAAGSLQQKLTTINPDANGVFTITFTDADLAEYIASQGGVFANSEARIENVQIGMLPQHIEISGDVTQPVAIPLTAQLQPAVVDGQLRFQVIGASAGILPVPDSMLAILEAGVNSGLSQAMSALPANVSLQDVALGTGSMTLLGQVN